MQRTAYYRLPSWGGNSLTLDDNEDGRSLVRRLVNKYKSLTSFEVWQVNVDAHGSRTITKIADSAVFCDESFPLHLVISPGVLGFDSCSMMKAPYGGVPSFSVAKELEDQLRDYVHDGTFAFLQSKWGWDDAPLRDIVFHELKSPGSKVETISSGVNALYSGKELTVLMNASGTGKTRLAVQGLATRWAIYLSCNTFHNPSSDDFRHFLARLRDNRFPSHEFVPPVSSPVARLQGPVQYCLKRLFCSRLIGLVKFLVYTSSAQASLPGISLQLRWLLLQVLSRKNLSRDIFLLQYNHLLKQPDNVVDELLASAWKTIRERIGPNQDFYLVVDEAQNIELLLPNVFKWEDGTWYEPHGLLEGVRAWFPEELRGQWKTILIGIELYFAPLPLDAHTLHGVGVFTDREQHAQYVAKRLWPNMPYNSAVLAHGEVLHRLFSWLRGRYRATASFIEMVNGYPKENLDMILDLYIYHGIRHIPPRTQSLPLFERTIVHDQFISDLASNHFLEDHVQWLHLFHLLFGIILHGRASIEAEQGRYLVRWGVCRYTDDSKSGFPGVVLDEPLTMCWVAGILGSKYHALLILKDYIDACFQRGEAAYTPTADARVDLQDYFHEDERRLDAVFEVLCQIPELRQETENLFPDRFRNRKEKGETGSGRSLDPIGSLPPNTSRLSDERGTGFPDGS